MEILTAPMSETQILAVTNAEATAEAVVQDIEAKGLSCVDHLCGCK